MTYMAKPCAPGVKKLTILVDPSLVIIALPSVLVCLIYACMVIEKKIFKEIQQFYTWLETRNCKFHGPPPQEEVIWG